MLAGRPVFPRYRVTSMLGRDGNLQSEPPRAQQYVLFCIAAEFPAGYNARSYYPAMQKYEARRRVERSHRDQEVGR
jgi:hypothetical protein